MVYEQGLEIIIGPMFSGKTTLLLSKLNTLHNIGLKVLYINHSIDKRSDQVFSTHCVITQNQQFGFDQIKAEMLMDIPITYVNKYDIIGIDEAQFFDKSIIDFVKYYVEMSKKYIIVAGLDGTYERKRFGNILDLIPLSDIVTKQYSYCKDCIDNKNKIKKGLFTYKYKHTNNSVIEVGDKDMYKTLCRECYVKNQHN